MSKKYSILNYNRSETINFNSEKDCFNYLEEILHTVLSIVRILVSTQTSLCNKIDQNYEKNIIDFIESYTPLDSYLYIFKSYEIVRELLDCMDITSALNKFILMKTNSIKFSTKLFVIKCIEDSLMDIKIKSFIKNLIDKKLNPIFECFDYALLNPKETLQNAKALTNTDDYDVFN